MTCSVNVFIIFYLNRETICGRHELNLSPLVSCSQLLAEEAIQEAGNWSHPVRSAEDVSLHQAFVHQEESGPREQDPEGQAAAETIKDWQQLRQEEARPASEAAHAVRWGLPRPNARAGKVHRPAQQERPEA